jgi:hypothetical protein
MLDSFWVVTSPDDWECQVELRFAKETALIFFFWTSAAPMGYQPERDSFHGCLTCRKTSAKFPVET